MTVQISGSSGYIADFSNATVSSRQAFQTSTTNGTTGIYALPNGTSTAASWQATNAADPTNASKILIATNGSTDVQLVSGINGTGTYLPLSFYTNGSQQMRLDTSGNLGIGVNPSAWGAGIWNALDIGAGALVGGKGSASNGTVLWYNGLYNGTNTVYKYNGSYASLELGSAGFIWALAGSGTAGGTVTTSTAMKLDSSGNLLVGKTTTPISGSGTLFQNDGKATFTGSYSTNANDTLDVYSSGASAYRFYVGMGGTVYATSTTISAISDQRFKENIIDLDVGLNSIMALKPRKFDWKDGKGKDIKGDRGFIAQEFKQIFPDLIDTWKDEAPEGEEPYMSVRQDLIPVLVKAIQEQQALIQALQNDVAALKAKP